MKLEANQKRGLLIGALIGAVLGAGVAYLMMTVPRDERAEEDEEPKPVTAMDLLALTSGAAALIRRLDDLRRRI